MLVEAISAGIPVVATYFPHAIELLRDGTGLLVPHENVPAMAEALSTLLSHAGDAEPVHAIAMHKTEDTGWPAVAEQYRLLANQMLAVRVA